MMTANEMKQIIETKVPFSDLIKNSGIYELDTDGDISIGVSFEEDEDGNDRYIYNLFWQEDEYINIYSVGNSEAPINEEIINELVEAWNSLLD